MEQIANITDNIMYGDNDIVTCPNCGTSYDLEIASITGFKSREDIVCDKCGSKIAERICSDYNLRQR